MSASRARGPQPRPQIVCLVPRWQRATHQAGPVGPPPVPERSTRRASGGVASPVVGAPRPESSPGSEKTGIEQAEGSVRLDLLARKPNQICEFVRGHRPTHGKSLGPLVARTPRRRRDAFYVARQRHGAAQRRPAAIQSEPTPASSGPARAGATGRCSLGERPGNELDLPVP